MQSDVPANQRIQNDRLLESIIGVFNVSARTTAEPEIDANSLHAIRSRGHDGHSLHPGRGRGLVQPQCLDLAFIGHVESGRYLEVLVETLARLRHNPSRVLRAKPLKTVQSHKTL